MRIRPRHAAPLLFALVLLGAPPARAAAVSWIGGSNGLWTDAPGWSGGVVPSPGDDVTIAGATVSVGDARTVSGSLTLAENARLAVGGAGASLTVSGTANIDGGRLYAADGGQLHLPTVTAYHRTRCEPGGVAVVDFVTVGNGGTVDLSALTSLAVDVPGCAAFQLTITVFPGGTLDLSQLQSMAAADPHVVTINDAGAIALPGLASAQSVSFFLNDPASALDLPSLTSFQGGGVSVVDGQRFTASALAAASGVTMLAAHDDAIVMNALATLTDARVFLNASHLAFPALTTLHDTSIQIQDGGVLDAPQLTTYTNDRPDVFMTGGVLQAPALRAITNLNLGVAETVSTMRLPGVTSYAWTLCEGLGSITAGGGGSIDLSGLQTFTIDVPGCGPLAFNAGAVTGGSIDMSSLETIVIPNQQVLAFLAGNPGSVVDLSSLTTFPKGRVLFAETDGGRILRPPGDGGGGGGGSPLDTTSIRTRLDALRAALPRTDARAQKQLGKLLTKVEKKLAAAEAGAAARSAKRVRRGLKGARKLLVRFGKRVQKLQPKHIADPAVGAALVAGAADAVADVEALQAANG
jgi:hypothetical protein